MEYAGQIWCTQTRYLGVGAMLVGGLWALIRMGRSLVTGMINDANFFALPSVVPRNEQSGADLYNYRITIESADGLHTVEATQLSVPESLEPLIVWLDRRPSGDSSDASNRP